MRHAQGCGPRAFGRRRVTSDTRVANALYRTTNLHVGGDLLVLLACGGLQRLTHDALGLKREVSFEMERAA